MNKQQWHPSSYLPPGTSGCDTWLCCYMIYVCIFLKLDSDILLYLIRGCILNVKRGYISYVIRGYASFRNMWFYYLCYTCLFFLMLHMLYVDILPHILYYLCYTWLFFLMLYMLYYLCYTWLYFVV